MTKTTVAGIEKMVKAHGIDDFKWISPKSIIPRRWVRTKCLYGCRRYGQKACCPPEVPSLAECREFFREFRRGLLFHIAKKLESPGMRFTWAREVNKQVLALEREVFLSGFYKAFVFNPSTCYLCDSCQSSKRECHFPFLARPTLEAFGVDVYATARKMGYPIQVLRGYEEEMNRYGLLLIE